MATMAALKSTSTFLHIGDRISLFHEPSNGYVGAEGFANVLVACDPSDGKVSDDKTRNEARCAAHRCPLSPGAGSARPSLARRCAMPSLWCTRWPTTLWPSS